MPRLLLCSLTVFLTACANGPDREPPPMEHKLHTSIYDNGSKLFVFQMLRGAGPDGTREGAGPRGGGNGGPPPGGGRGGKPGKGPDPDKMLKQAHEALALTLAETGYCREGYMTLEEKTDRGQLAIRGECTETATEADREEFGKGKLPQWY